MSSRISRRAFIGNGIAAAGGLAVTGSALAQGADLRGRRTKRVVVWSEETLPKERLSE